MESPSLIFRQIKSLFLLSQTETIVANSIILRYSKGSDNILSKSGKFILNIENNEWSRYGKAFTSPKDITNQGIGVEYNDWFNIPSNYTIGICISIIDDIFSLFKYLCRHFAFYACLKQIIMNDHSAQKIYQLGEMQLGELQHFNTTPLGEMQPGEMQFGEMQLSRR
ncbi:hypothetical protein H8356DRAFT_1329799 [Neocallimastix lanati (nom. inval.)]|nr:hypothetical protein H8356DRAFT_1329799 [Neocallimastix sp. JGI-2020a]